MWIQPPFDQRAAAERAPVEWDDVGGRQLPVMGDEVQDISLDAQDDDVKRFAESGRTVRDGVEHWLHVRR